MPTLDKLYPEAIYNDKVSFYYNDSNESGNTLGILTTHVPGMEQNMKLKPTVNRKIEVGPYREDSGHPTRHDRLFSRNKRMAFPPRHNIFHSAIGNMIIYQPPNFVLNTKMDRYG